MTAHAFAMHHIRQNASQWIVENFLFIFFFFYYSRWLGHSLSSVNNECDTLEYASGRSWSSCICDPRSVVYTVLNFYLMGDPLSPMLNQLFGPFVHTIFSYLCIWCFWAMAFILVLCALGWWMARMNAGRVCVCWKLSSMECTGAQSKGVEWPKIQLCKMQCCRSILTEFWLVFGIAFFCSFQYTKFFCKNLFHSIFFLYSTIRTSRSLIWLSILIRFRSQFSVLNAGLVRERLARSIDVPLGRFCCFEESKNLDGNRIWKTEMANAFMISNWESCFTFSIRRIERLINPQGNSDGRISNKIQRPITTSNIIIRPADPEEKVSTNIKQTCSSNSDIQKCVSSRNRPFPRTIPAPSLYSSNNAFKPHNKSY